MLKLKTLENFFFEAMQQGWAAGGTPMPMRHFRGWHKIEFTDWKKYRGLMLRDCWGIDPDSGRPSGQTIIFEHTFPVWAMWYGKGGYKKEGLPFLREVLMENYSRHIFRSGRGPQKWRIRGRGGEGISYRNWSEGDFSQFKGQEVLFDEKGQKELGHHEFWGGSLVYLE